MVSYSSLSLLVMDSLLVLLYLHASYQVMVICMADLCLLTMMNIMNIDDDDGCKQLMVIVCYCYHPNFYYAYSFGLLFYFLTNNKLLTLYRFNYLVLFFFN